MTDPERRCTRPIDRYVAVKRAISFEHGAQEC